MEPKVGQGATLICPSDRYPFAVVAVSPSRRKVTLQGVSTAGLKPEGKNADFPVFDHRFTPAEFANATYTTEEIVAWRQSDGTYRFGGCPVTFGTARYYRDYSD
jgi:hypothetical protein